MATVRITTDWGLEYELVDSELHLLGGPDGARHLRIARLYGLEVLCRLGQALSGRRIGVKFAVHQRPRRRRQKCVGDGRARRGGRPAALQRIVEYAEHAEAR